jgi:serine/threonine protein kinase
MSMYFRHDHERTRANGLATIRPESSHPLQGAALDYNGARMALTSGTKLGPYEIVTPLGAGGMGEVYRARDKRLNRTVAIKILPEAFASEADRLQRFEHEARILSTLNHPNLLAIYDVGAQDGIHYLVSEFLEGQTLRERMSGAALPQRKVTEYALQIANGLAAAHDKGIVHRDLKPENVFVTREERVKILDFGLAKQSHATNAVGEGATMTSPNPTAAGMVLGTVGYMSPEQVKGQAADHRSDIFSFGAILYEMATGRRAFRGESSVETMNAILKEDPPELEPGSLQVSPGVERIVRRCLEKSPARRFQSASDLAFAIESQSGSAITVSIPKQERRWGTRTAWAVGALLAGAMILMVLRSGQQFGTRTQPVFHRLTYQRGYVPNGRFAKDGQTIIYSAQWNNDPVQVYSVRAEFPQSAKVDLPSSSLLALSSNGDLALIVSPVFHANFASGTMAQAAMTGGSPRALEENVMAADYSPDGTTLALARQGNGKVQLEFPAGKTVYETTGYLDYLRFSRDGKHVAFLEHPVYGDDRGWVSVIDGQGNRKRLTAEYAAEQGLAWSSGGDEVWFTASNSGPQMDLYGVNLEGKSRTILRSPQRMRLLDVAGDGRVLLDSEQFKNEITGLDPEARKERAGLEWFDGSVLADISPDGKAILFNEWGGTAGPLYLVCYRKLDGSPPVALGPGASPRFSPDGKTAAALLFTSPPKIILHPIGTGESRELPLGNLSSVFRTEWSPDGKHLLVVGTPGSHAAHSYNLNLETGNLQPIGPDDWQGAAVSKDGKQIAGWRSSGEAAVFDVVTQQMHMIPGLKNESASTTLRADANLDRWTLDGQGVLLMTTFPDLRVYRIEVATGRRTLLHEVQLNDRAGAAYGGVLFVEGRKTYVYGVRRSLGSLYMVEGLQ